MIAIFALTLAAIAVWFWCVFRPVYRERRAFRTLGDRIGRSFAQLTAAVESMGRSVEQLIPIMEAFGQAVRDTELEEGDE